MRTAMIWTHPTVKVATTQAGLTAGTAVECQVTSAMLNSSNSPTTIPATGCSGATQSPGQSQFALDLAWLQDWSAGDATESLSRFAWENDAMPVWVEIVPDSTDATDSVMSGEFYCSAGGFGGTFGDGSAGEATATWNAVSKPTIGAATVTP